VDLDLFVTASVEWSTKQAMAAAFCAVIDGGFNERTGGD
jgi:hypothetical protein